MSTIPTFSRKKPPSETATLRGKDEVITKPWTFSEGIATRTLRMFDNPSDGAVLTSDSLGNASWGTVSPSTNLQRTGGTITETATFIATALGEYVAYVYVECTSAGSAGTLDVTFTYNDDISAVTSPIVATVDLSATNRDYGIAFLRCAGGGIDYTFTVTAAAGGPVYSVYLNILQVR